MYQKKELLLKGVVELRQDGFSDIRGTSFKPFHLTSFKNMGINIEFKEELVVASKKDVIRGMHFQHTPYAQAKLIYCIKGSVLDVILDIRKESPTYGQSIGIEISAEQKNSIYIPEGFAHGYVALEEDSILIYKMSNEYTKEYEEGIRWDSFNFNWGVEKPIISKRDEGFEPFSSFKSPF